MVPVYFHQKGMSLVELMIAMVLGLFLMLGIVEIFSGTKATYNLQEGLSRVQESARVGMQVIGSESFHAGVVGCGNMTSYFDNSAADTIQGQNVSRANYLNQALDPILSAADEGIVAFNYTGTSPGETFAIPATLLTPITARTNWSPQLPDSPLLNGRVLAGSDVLIVRRIEDTQRAVDTVFPGVDGTTPATVDLLTAPPANALTNGAIYAVSDCKGAMFFQGFITGPAQLTANFVGTPGNRAIAWPQEHQRYGANAGVGRVVLSVFYVGLGADPGFGAPRQPSLFRSTYAFNAAGLPQAQHDELVEGVESFQVLFGVAGRRAISATESIFTDSADRFVAAPFVEDRATASVQTFFNDNIAAVVAENGKQALISRRWDNVRSFKVSLLVRSPEEVQVEPDTRTFVVSRGTNTAGADASLTLDPQNDRRIRQAYEQVFQLRNRSFSRLPVPPPAP